VRWWIAYVFNQITVMGMPFCDDKMHTPEPRLIDNIRTEDIPEYWQHKHCQDAQSNTKMHNTNAEARSIYYL
jgi:hypothetical protein